MVSQYVNGTVAGSGGRHDLRALFSHDREIDGLLATIDRLAPSFRPIDPDPGFVEQLRNELDQWRPDKREEPTITWRKLIIPVAAVCSVASAAAALVLLIGRRRSSGGRLERSFPTFSAG